MVPSYGSNHTAVECRPIGTAAMLCTNCGGGSTEPCTNCERYLVQNFLDNTRKPPTYLFMNTPCTILLNIAKKVQLAGLHKQKNLTRSFKTEVQLVRRLHNITIES